MKEKEEILKSITVHDFSCTKEFLAVLIDIRDVLVDIHGEILLEREQYR